MELDSYLDDEHCIPLDIRDSNCGLGMRSLTSVCVRSDCFMRRMEAEFDLLPWI